MSISTRITAIEEHITNAYDKIDDLGIDLTGVDKNIDNIAELLEDVYEGYPKVTAQGTEATMEGTKAGKMKLDIKGNSTQDTTEGYNLFDVNVIQERTTQGITMSFSGQTINLSGTASGNANFYMKSGKSIVLPAGTYYIQRTSLVNIGTLKLTSGADTILTTGNTDTTFTLANETTIDGLTLQVSSSVGTINKNVVLLLCSGNTSKPYEPYTGGLPSPNPSYPQPIHSAGDNINLFDKDTPYASPNKAINDDGDIITASGYSVYKVPLKANSTYTFQKNNTASTYIRIVLMNSSDEKEGLVVSGNISTIGTYTKTFTTTSATTYAYIQIKTTDENVKLVEGTNVGSYSPYNMGCITEKIVNKNLIPTNPSDWEQGTLSGSGSNIGQPVSSTTRLRTKEYYAIEPNVYYYVSIEDTNYCFLNIFLYDKDNNFINQYYAMDNLINGTTSRLIRIPISSEINKTITKMKIILRKSDNTSTITPSEITSIKPMIEQGSTATEFVAHQEQTYTIPVQQPMKNIENSNGDIITADKFINVNGNWIERHEIKTAVYDGSDDEGWNYEYKTYYKPNFDGKPFTSLDVDNPLAKSNSFIWQNGTSTTFVYGAMWYILNGTRLRIQKDANPTAETLADFKTWLSTHNLIVDYVASSYTDLPCTSEQTAILEQMVKSYPDVTHIYSEDGVPIYFDATALEG